MRTNPIASDRYAQTKLITFRVLAPFRQYSHLSYWPKQRLYPERARPRTLRVTSLRVIYPSTWVANLRYHDLRKVFQISFLVDHSELKIAVIRLISGRWRWGKTNTTILQFSWSMTAKDTATSDRYAHYISRTILLFPTPHNLLILKQARSSSERLASHINLQCR